MLSMSRVILIYSLSLHSLDKAQTPQQLIEIQPPNIVNWTENQLSSIDQIITNEDAQTDITDILYKSLIIDWKD
jgi:hypothetical protein